MKALLTLLAILVVGPPAWGQVKHPGVWKMVSCTKHGDILTLSLTGPSQMTVVYDNKKVESDSDCGDFEMNEKFVRVTEPLTAELKGRTVMCPEEMIPKTSDLKPESAKYEWDLFCGRIVAERGTK
jgi:hypothetical protein